MAVSRINHLCITNLNSLRTIDSVLLIETTDPSHEGILRHDYMIVSNIVGPKGTIYVPSGIQTGASSACLLELTHALTHSATMAGWYHCLLRHNFIYYDSTHIYCAMVNGRFEAWWTVWECSNQSKHYYF